MDKAMIIGLVILVLIMWFWAITNLLKSRFKHSRTKAVWLLIVLVFPVLGPIIYFQLRKVLLTGPSEFHPFWDKDETHYK